LARETVPPLILGVLRVGLVRVLFVRVCVAVSVTVAELYAAKDWMVLEAFLKYSKPSA
jgi:hypothetical protein